MARSPKYKTNLELQKKVDEYFVQCDDKKQPYTIPGLAYFLGFCDRHAVSELAKKKAFSATISRARLRIEAQRAKQLITEKNTRGIEFDLKNNFNWRDKQEVDVNANFDDNVKILVPGKMSPEEWQKMMDKEATKNG